MVDNKTPQEWQEDWDLFARVSAGKVATIQIMAEDIQKTASISGSPEIVQLAGRILEAASGITSCLLLEAAGPARSARLTAILRAVAEKLGQPNLQLEKTDAEPSSH